MIGAEKMTAVGSAEITRAQGNASCVREEAATSMGFPGIFAQTAQACFERHGHPGATLAQIAARNHANGMRNLGGSAVASHVSTLERRS